jgi:hypothetical protein
MKNIHVLQKNIFNQLGVDHYGKTPTQIKIAEFLINKNIYITSNEKIKEGVDQWYLDKVLNEPYNSGGAQYSSNQDVIILTTDLDLIKDGVQAIDDEFLEWFVKNPTCEFVEVTYENDTDLWGCDFNYYKIIIPKEEPKQLTDLKIAMKLEEIEKEESKQDYSGVHLRHCYQGEYEDGCKYGEDDCPAKLLEKIEEDDERMYSEEEVYKLLLKHQSDYRSSVRNSYPLTWSFDIKDWFEKFKKK